MLLATVGSSEALCAHNYIPIEEVAKRFCLADESPTAAAEHAEIESSLTATNSQRQTVFTAYQDGLKRLLPVEFAVREELDKKYQEELKVLDAKISELQAKLSAYQQSGRGDKLNQKYKRIDLSFLKRRKWSSEYQCALPLFVIYSSEDSTCAALGSASYTISHRRRITAKAHCQFSPEVMANYCADLASLLQYGAIGRLPLNFVENPVTFIRDCRATLTLKSRFSGAIPEEIRNTINTAKQEFENIYFVTEAPEWKFDSENVITEHDRTKSLLVIGEKKGNFWLVIAKFATISAKEYASSQFSLCH